MPSADNASPAGSATSSLSGRSAARAYLESKKYDKAVIDATLRRKFGSPSVSRTSSGGSSGSGSRTDSPATTPRGAIGDPHKPGGPGLFTSGPLRRVSTSGQSRRSGSTSARSGSRRRSDSSASSPKGGIGDPHKPSGPGLSKWFRSSATIGRPQNNIFERRASSGGSGGPAPSRSWASGMMNGLRAGLGWAASSRAADELEDVAESRPKPATPRAGGKTSSSGGTAPSVPRLAKPPTGPVRPTRAELTMGPSFSRKDLETAFVNSMETRRKERGKALVTPLLGTPAWGMTPAEIEQGVNLMDADTPAPPINLMDADFAMPAPVRAPGGRRPPKGGVDSSGGNPGMALPASAGGRVPSVPLPGMLLSARSWGPREGLLLHEMLEMQRRRKRARKSAGKGRRGGGKKTAKGRKKAKRARK